MLQINLLCFIILMQSLTVSLCWFKKTKAKHLWHHRLHTNSYSTHIYWVPAHSLQWTPLTFTEVTLRASPVLSGFTCVNLHTLLEMITIHKNNNVVGYNFKKQVTCSAYYMPGMILGILLLLTQLSLTSTLGACIFTVVILQRRKLRHDD